MNGIDRNELYGHVQKLPALSSVVTELLTSIDQEEVDLDSIVKKISCDQVLTIKTLRLANSSFYGMQHKISSIHEAINILGFKNVRMLISASAIASSFSFIKLKHFSFSSFWNHSIGTAICAREIARHVGANQELAFIAGLIHDIGKLVLVTHYPEQYESALEYQIKNQCESKVAEFEMLGVDHREISKEVLVHWKFPIEMRDAASGMNLDEDKPVDQLTGVIHLADVFALALDFSNDEFSIVPKIVPSVWEQLHLNEKTCHAICAQSLEKFEELSQMLVT